MRFLHLIKPIMCILPEVAAPDRKVLLILVHVKRMFRMTSNILPH